VPLAVANDGLFPRAFARLTSRGTPAFGLIVSSTLTTILIAMNYTRDLVGLFTFVILLATLSTLVPYVFSTLAGFLIERQAGARQLRGSPRTTLVGLVAFGYSMWAIGGAGADVVYWGFLLLLAGLPVYVWVVRQRPLAS
jgi:APA family basic amino acid/polyamine antiporter